MQERRTIEPWYAGPLFFPQYPAHKTLYQILYEQELARIEQERIEQIQIHQARLEYARQSRAAFLLGEPAIPHTDGESFGSLRAWYSDERRTSPLYRHSPLGFELEGFRPTPETSPEGPHVLAEASSGDASLRQGDAESGAYSRREAAVHHVVVPMEVSSPVLSVTAARTLTHEETRGACFRVSLLSSSWFISFNILLLITGTMGILASEAEEQKPLFISSCVLAGLGVIGGMSSLFFHLKKKCPTQKEHVSPVPLSVPLLSGE